MPRTKMARDTEVTMCGALRPLVSQYYNRDFALVKSRSVYKSGPLFHEFPPSLE